MSVDRSKEAFLKENENRIICGDALETLKNFPDESINCSITSPRIMGLGITIKKSKSEEKKR